MLCMMIRVASLPQTPTRLIPRCVCVSGVGDKFLGGLTDTGAESKGQAREAQRESMLLCSATKPGVDLTFHSHYAAKGYDRDLNTFCRSRLQHYSLGLVVVSQRRSSVGPSPPPHGDKSCPPSPRINAKHSRESALRSKTREHVAGGLGGVWFFFYRGPAPSPIVSGFP